MSKLSKCQNERLPQEKVSQVTTSTCRTALCWFYLCPTITTILSQGSTASEWDQRDKTETVWHVCDKHLSARITCESGRQWELMKWTVHSLVTLTKPCQLAFACATRFSLHLILLCRASQWSRSAVWDSRSAAVSADELTTILWSAWLSIARACNGDVRASGRRPVNRLPAGQHSTVSSFASMCSAHRLHFRHSDTTLIVLSRRFRHAAARPISGVSITWNFPNLNYTKLVAHALAPLAL